MCFLWGAPKAAHYGVFSGVDSSWPEHGLSVLLFSRNLLVLQILTWTSRSPGLLLLDMASLNLETPFFPAYKWFKRKEMEFVEAEKQVIY